jgi:hypothetical protein
MRSGLVWLLAVLGASAVAGCTTASPDDPPPTIISTYHPHSHPAISTDPPPISTGANVRPGEKPPSFPPSLNRNVPASADAFARYWERAIDWGYATADASLARSAFSQECTDCLRFMKIFDHARANGVHFMGGRSHVIETQLQPNDHWKGATAVDDVTVTVGALDAIDNAGKVIESDPPVARATYRVWMQWTTNRWTVVDWKQVVEK